MVQNRHLGNSEPFRRVFSQNPSCPRPFGTQLLTPTMDQDTETQSVSKPKKRNSADGDEITPGVRSKRGKYTSAAW